MASEEHNNHLKGDNVSEHEPSGPPGGCDSTPVPHRPPGYTVKITFHRATHLPMADFAGFASDPYLRAELKTEIPPRHREDPPMQFRTRTVWKTTDPEWNEEWIIHHMPSSGFRLKARIYDEDSNDRDDRLGNAHIHVPAFDEHWEGIYNKAYEIGKRSGSLRAYAVRGLAVGLGAAKRMSGRLWVSVHVLGKSPGTEGGRPYTVGRLYWSKHYSPLLGRIVGRMEPDDDKNSSEKPKAVADDPNLYKSPPRTDTDADTYGDLADHYEHFKPEDKEKSIQRYNFQAAQLQLRGPVPPELYHRYVEFRPFVKSMYTATGFRGMILSKAFHHQHQQVYNFDRTTVYGSFAEPSLDMTIKFLDLCHFARGGRIHTYVITLDGLMRFTETGKEFGIDLLSKHTMHSDRGVYIAYSGEFFIRKKKKHPRKSADNAYVSPSTQGQSADLKAAELGPDAAARGGHSRETSQTDNELEDDPSNFELIIDNDSGTYRPNAKLLPQLREFVSTNFPGLSVITLDCQEDAELMTRLKNEQREKKRREGKTMVFMQASRTNTISSSGSDISSSEEERLDSLSAAQEEEAEGKKSRGGHKLGEAVAPFLGDHERLRKAVGAPKRS